MANHQQQNVSPAPPHIPLPPSPPLQQPIVTPDQMFLMLMEQNQCLMEMLAQCEAPKAIKVAKPDEFDSKSEHLEAFLRQLEMYFEAHASQFTDYTKCITYAISFMKKGVLGQWAQSLWTAILQNRTIPRAAHPYRDWEEFKEGLSNVFGDSDPTATAHHKMTIIKQGT